MTSRVVRNARALRVGLIPAPAFLAARLAKHARGCPRCAIAVAKLSRDLDEAEASRAPSMPALAGGCEQGQELAKAFLDAVDDDVERERRERAR